MDFPLAPHTIRKVENKADHGGEDVVVYDRGQSCNEDLRRFWRSAQ